MRSQEDLLNILRNGGGLDISVGTRNTDDLVQLARNTRDKATLILRDVGSRANDDLVHISRNANGKIIFVL